MAKLQETLMASNEEQFSHFPSVVDYAYEIVRMHQKIQRLESEVENLAHYKKLYFEACDNQVQQTQRLFGIAVAGALGDIETAQRIANS